MRAIMVEQLGLAMIPPCPYRMPFMASAFTSGMTNGTPSVILKAELLSTTCSNDTPAFHTHTSVQFLTTTITSIIVMPTMIMITHVSKGSVSLNLVHAASLIT